MIVETIAGYRKLRVWLDELPDAVCRNGVVLRHTVSVPETVSANAASGAVELFYPTGARALYGLLGGTFTPGIGSHVDVEFLACDESDHALDWSYATGFDPKVGVYRGDYPPFVFEGVERVASSLGPGTLVLDRAAQSTGSGPIVFRWLARKVTELLAAHDHLRSPEQLEAFIDLGRMSWRDM